MFVVATQRLTRGVLRSYNSFSCSVPFRGDCSILYLVLGFRQAWGLGQSSASAVSTAVLLIPFVKFLIVSVASSFRVKVPRPQAFPPVFLAEVLSAFLLEWKPCFGSKYLVGRVRKLPGYPLTR